MLVTVTMCRKRTTLVTAKRLRMTQQRLVILEEVRRLGSHPTAEDVHRRVRARLPRISLATIYRNLEKLSEFGMLHKLELSGSRRRFDGRAGSHYHVRCLGCGRVADVEIDSVAGLEGGVARKTGYHVRGHRLEFVGLCPSCKEHKPVPQESGKRGRGGGAR